MASGSDQALTSHDGTAVRIAASNGGGHDVPMQLTCLPSADGHAMIALRGDLDLATVDEVVRYVIDIMDRYDGLVSADLSGVAFCDACGLSALIRIAAYAERAGRRLELVRPSRALTRIMRITGVDHLLLAAAHAS
jgi:anti-sigma B factor antagonist